MKFIETPLKGAYIVQIELLEDSRGFFGRTYCKRDFEVIGHSKDFVQFNMSFTKLKGTIRGMHYQLLPSGEVKLVRCIRGCVWDVIVDLRKESLTFLQHFAIKLSCDNFKMIYIPEGFAHGFQTLDDNSELIYHHTAYFSPEYERGLRYNDPSLKINWPLPLANISERDSSHPFITEDFLGLIS